MDYLRYNTIQTVVVGPFFAVDGLTPQITLTNTNTLASLTASTDNATAPTLIFDAVAGNDGTHTLTHITSDAAGYYSFTLVAADCNAYGSRKLTFIDADVHCPVFHEYRVLPQAVFDAWFGTGALRVNVTAINGTTLLGNGNATPWGPA